MLKTTQDVIDDLHSDLDAQAKQIASLREEIKRLRANALEWKKWPENIPDKSGIYLIKAEGDFISIGDYDFKYDYWVADEEMVNVTHWAEIPRPEES